VITAPFPVTQELKNRAASASGIFIAFIISIAFSLVPAAVVSFILNEREKNLKHMQLISGMSLPAYWLTNMVFDVVKGIIPSIIVIGLMYAFGLNYDDQWILFLLYPLAVIPFTYVTSFFFSSENIA
jgi:ATP-binding cassette subfamily A (ABC1) protein 3